MVGQNNMMRLCSTMERNETAGKSQQRDYAPVPERDRACKAQSPVRKPERAIFARIEHVAARRAARRRRRIWAFTLAWGFARGHCATTPRTIGKDTSFLRVEIAPALSPLGNSTMARRRHTGACSTEKHEGKRVKKTPADEHEGKMERNGGKKTKSARGRTQRKGEGKADKGGENPTNARETVIEAKKKKKKKWRKRQKIKKNETT
ncbi:hypothetical protein C8J57DRAFT_1248527 [Mycena rebaudengoi]|nr:hypothetical protein C8J57DRAFT_1248527 [Mycena rebaudengoi]